MILFLYVLTTVLHFGASAAYFWLDNPDLGFLWLAVALLWLVATVIQATW